jgi:hypothetical protein
MINEKKIESAWRNDLDQLATHVKHQLGGRVRDLRVLLHPAGIILQGRTETYHAKQLVQHAVMEATEVPISANDIEVS